MRLSLLQWFMVVVALGAVAAFYLDLGLGMSYLASALVLLLPWVVLGSNTDTFPLWMVAAGTLWGGYLLRPLVLAAFPEHYLFWQVHTPSLDEIAAAVLRSGGYSVAFLLGIRCGLVAMPRVRPVERVPFLVRNQVLSIGAVAAFILLFAFLTIVDRSGVRGLEAGQFAFALRLVPEMTLYAILVLYLTRYRRLLSIGVLMVVVGLSLLQVVLVLNIGSKAAIGNFAIASLLLALLRFGNWSSDAAGSLSVATVMLLLVFVSFPLARVIRERNLQGTQATLRDFERQLGEFRLGEVAEAFTSRVTGADGLIVTTYHRPPGLEDSFRPRAVAQSALASLIPRYTASEYGMGKALGVYYRGHSENVVHADAVGLFGASQLMLGRRAALVPFAIALMFGLMYSAASRCSGDLALLLKYVVIFSTFRWLISGNIDILFSLLVIAVAQILFYGTSIQVASLVLGGRSMERVRQLAA